jgi:anaerobic magnesium-protoporphyrin IX monomethyl ester cyclase
MNRSALDLLVLYPNNRERAFGQLADVVAAVTPPVQAGLIASYARRAGLQVSILDAEVDNLSAASSAEKAQALQPKLVTICTDSLNSGDVTKMQAAIDTLRELKELLPETPVVLEGVVPSAYPERLLREENCDFVCQGEAFESIVELTRSLASGNGDSQLRDGNIPGIWMKVGDEIIESERSSLVDQPDSLPSAAWDLMPPSQYRAHHWHCFDSLDRRTPYASIFTNLGCPYPCTFCNVNVVAGGPNFRPRTPESVINEIEYLVNEHQVRNIRILDNVFTIRLDLVEELCDRIIEKGFDLNMWCYARVETIRNREILDKMKKAGVNWVAYGIESASEKVRKGVEKPSDQKVIDRAVQWTREAGIYIVGNFIFGLPEDDLETMRESLDMAKEYDFEWANFYCAMAYPGTELYNYAVKEGLPLPDSWSGFGQYSVDALPLPSKHISPQEILSFRDDAFIEYFTHPPYLRLMEKTFGPDAVDFVKAIVKLGKPHRNLLAELRVTS